jgi:hypothetical protein
MKNFMFILLCCVAFCVPAAAQSGFRFGLTLQSNWFKTRMSDGFADPLALANNLTYENSRRFGFGAGLVLGYQFSDRFWVGAEPTVLRKGGVYNEVENGTWTFTDRTGKSVTVPNSIMKWDFQAWAVHVPLLGHVKVLGNDRFGLTAVIGPSFNFNFRGSTEQVCIDSEKTYPVADAKHKFGNERFDDYAAFDLSVVLGPGVEVNLDEDGFVKLNVEARWDLGTRTMYTSARRDYLQAQNADIIGTRKHRGFVLGASISYTLGEVE